MTSGRVAAAIEFMKENKSFLVDDLRFGVTQLGVIEITGWSQIKTFDKLNRKNALKELYAVKSKFLNMAYYSDELKDFIKGKQIRFNLWFDDLGKASIAICSEENGTIEWEAKDLK